ncbi:QWRF motif-containing protein 8 [Phtheirospermum japonicum]|uniref:QWRF motif-containing protein 8 n=1 Tax=Phtheirospermum japonicum TaxID=374723 RepID=A0A830CUJ1_9LAMI|nr:QWRF motif-containing protein 8 [Phtheirospermum japonicum]
MDVCESAKALPKQSTPERKRQPLVPAENKNKNGATFRAQTREVSSRYRSPTPSAPKRCPSPNAARLSSSTTSSVSAPKRATSAERRRPSRPSSPPSPTTPVQDTSAETMLASRKSVGNKLPESLWPSTMRSLSVSFQSDTYSIPVSSKKEKPVSPSDRTLRPSLNISASSRKLTPERKRSPLKGKNSTDQSENSKPVDGLHSRLVDQHRWPSRTSGKFPTALNRSIDLGDKTNNKTSTLSLRRLSLDGGASKPLLKSSSDLLIQISRDDDQMQRPGSSGSSDRALSNRTPGSRAQSPSVSRGVSPSRAKPVITPSRGSSPARGRPSSPSRQPQSSTSVLSFIADIKKGKKAANHIEDVHQLRLLYNRHLQWRYVNARTCAALQSQKVKAEVCAYVIGALHVL